MSRVKSDPLRDAWDRYLAVIDETGALVEATPRFQDRPANRASAYLGLHEAQAMAYTFALAPRTCDPLVYAQSTWHSHLFTLGQNCGDFRYGALFLDGRRSYRLTGRMGDLRLLLLQVHNRLLGHPQSEEIGNYDFGDFDPGPDGTFDVVVGAEPPAGGRNWIGLDGASPYNFLVVRRIAGDWADDHGELHLEPLGAAPSPSGDFDQDLMADRIDLAGGYLRFLVEQWNIGLYDLYVRLAGGRNRFAYIAGKELASDLVGSPSTTYGLAVFDIEEDEALIVEVDPPDAAYWSFQLGDPWSKSLDFAHHQTDVNMQRALLDADRKFRAVVSLDDPGVPNWLDPVGRLEGTIVMRNYRCRADHGAPTITKVPRAQVRAHLPGDTATITPEERRAALAGRRAAVRASFGL
ncbi:MAG: DUF1214 domain-containing protein [Actinobacteria bacterium]|nr:DUF1214 domain-containing protein [Actinomycetota bacterium]